MSSPSGRLKKQARVAQRALMRAAMAASPRLPHLVISGFPVSEGNAVEMVRVSASRYPGRVFWLVSDVVEARQVLAACDADPTHRVEIVRHRSLSAMWRFVTAEVSMFTHGLFGNPAPVPGKTMVNLWHGGGFKGAIMADARGRPTIRSHYLVASSRQFATLRARECALPPNGLLFTGNPRIDQFSRSGAPIDRIGLSRERPFVVWMPTFRKNKGRGLTGSWTDLHGNATVDLATGIAAGVAVLTRELGIDVVVKPHPQDAESRAIVGAVVVTNENLSAAGIQLYELLGASSGLLTDYSSVWVDYLALDRPIGFFVPDEEEYGHGRGFSPADALDWLPGPRISTVDEFWDFGRDVHERGIESAARRAEVARHIGHVALPQAAHGVLDALSAARVFSEPLRERASQ